MPQDHSTSESNYRRFIERISESGEVWGLESKDGWAYCPSNEYEDTDVLVFWSDRASAQRHAHDDWSDHHPAKISLEDFVDQWLQGMHEDGALVGPDWDDQLHGLEVEPHELAAELTKE